MSVTIEEIQKIVNSLCEKIHAPKSIVGTSPFDDGRPYLSVENDEYNYIYSERGYEFSRKKTSSPDELLFWIMYDVVHQMAVSYELNHRIEGCDVRRLIFRKVIEYLSQLKSEWGEKAKEKFNQILVQDPFKDNLKL
ncbi:Imm63 family immunity protein [Pantoea phytobeneficialis]|uniref:Imm63 family immunity protein n=1 Tax=Pantoea phytobeneficialis TaxID=2052056 RepID=A0AAP9KS62_9GAMM|nr:Imm63 family immunity protein [Pantoea phytobeneficialis]MDO6409912.1 Imm63 family immunity protein [Pantoea phytobeneficialis]QGR09779.1 hypothetical protein CTZ24_25350 [Pantoea phytobeneficialis]